MDFEPALTDILGTWRLHKQADIISPVQLICKTNIVWHLKVGFRPLDPVKRAVRSSGKQGWPEF